MIWVMRVRYSGDPGYPGVMQMLWVIRVRDFGDIGYPGDADDLGEGVW